MKFSEIHAIWRREVKKELADRASLLMGVLFPLFMIFVLGIGFDSFVKLKGIDTSYTAFLGPGIIAIMAMGGAAHVGQSMIKDKESYLKELLVAPISRTSIFIGKILGTMVIRFVMLLIIVLIFLEIIDALSFSSIIWALIFMFLIEFVFYGFNLGLGFFFKRAGTYQQFIGLVNVAIIFLSGAFFPIQNLPTAMKVFVYINPLTYGVDGLRGQLTGVHQFPLAVNVLVLVFAGIVMTGLGAFIFRKLSQTT